VKARVRCGPLMSAPNGSGFPQTIYPQAMIRVTLAATHVILTLACSWACPKL